MNGKLVPEMVVGDGDEPQADLPLAVEGVQRIVCRLKYAEVLVEVVGDEVFVNGKRVEPARVALAAKGDGTDPR